MSEQESLQEVSEWLYYEAYEQVWENLGGNLQDIGLLDTVVPANQTLLPHLYRIIGQVERAWTFPLQAVLEKMDGSDDRWELKREAIYYLVLGLAGHGVSIDDLPEWAIVENAWGLEPRPKVLIDIEGPWRELAEDTIYERYATVSCLKIGCERPMLATAERCSDCGTRRVVTPAAATPPVPPLVAGLPTSRPRRQGLQRFRRFDLEM